MAQKGPMKDGLSIRLSACFLGIVSLVFSKFLHGARNVSKVARDRAGFSGKM